MDGKANIQAGKRNGKPSVTSVDPCGRAFARKRAS